MRHPNVRNADEVEVREMTTLTEVAPGGISFPRHAHYVNEEAIYVLSGCGEARIGDARAPVRPGDWIALPTGPEHAHQMVNVSTVKPLVYLCISTMRGAEIVEYPDSGKIGAGVADPRSPVGFRRLGMFRAGSGTLDYWESERHGRARPVHSFTLDNRIVAISLAASRRVRAIAERMTRPNQTRPASGHGVEPRTAV